jgi:hypothetical protein
MATIPNPRSYQQILGEMIDTFMARLGLKGLKIGGPALSILEAAAASDTKATQDIFGLLDADSVDRATGEALDRIAQSENLTRLGAVSAVGRVRFSDTSFSKVTTVLDPNLPSPAIGATSFTVSDASGFNVVPPGLFLKVYIGRGTANYEGPLVVVNKAGNTLFLSGSISKYHAPGELVTLGQGGDRNIASGTLVTTSNKYSGGVIQFTTLQSTTIDDGETNSTEVECVCTAPGTIGNVSIGAISTFATGPFTGATVTNDLPITNGRNVESDEELRARIKLNKQSRTKGTVSALKAAVLGISSDTEHKTVASSSFVQGIGTTPNTLYIDDGNGYEEQTAGIGLERLTVSAQGGEQIFQLVGGRPVVKAFVETNIAEPYELVDASTLAVEVGQVLSEHTFSANEFVDIGQATAEEIVASINGNANLKFNARTSANGSRVVIFAKAESGNEIEVVDPGTTDANLYLGFPTGINYDVLLYKNDELLYEDGRLARLRTTPNTEWGSLADGIGFSYVLDGTAGAFTINDADFVNAGTQYTSVALAGNDLQAWRKVFNYKLSGVTVSVENDYLVFTSNLGRNDNAGFEVDDGSPFVAENVFNDEIGLVATGKGSDYTFNRNTGQLELVNPLVSGDELSAGSSYTRAYVQSAEHPTQTITLSNAATFWVSVDGNAREITTDLTSRAITTSYAAGTLTFSFAGGASTDDIQRGDWIIAYDSALSTHIVGRINTPTLTGPVVITATVGDTIQDFTADVGISLNEGGVKIIRTSTEIQPIRLLAGNNRPIQDIVDEINGMATGFTAMVYHGNYIRLTTDDYTPNGSILYIGHDVDGADLLITNTDLVQNTIAQVAWQQGKEWPNTPFFTSNDASVYRLTGTTQNHRIQHLASLANDGPSTAAGLSVIHAASVWNANKFGHNYHIERQVRKIDTSTRKQLRYLSTNFVSQVNIGGLVRAANVVTATTTTAHKFKPGDIIWVRSEVADANFPENAFIVNTVPSATTLTYDDTGAGAASVELFEIRLSNQFSVTDDMPVSVQPLTITDEDSITIQVNNNPQSTFDIPLYRNIKLNGAYNSPMPVVDEDNSGNLLEDAFGNDFDFADFAVYMRARQLLNKPAGDGIYYRYPKYGAEGQGVRVRYDAPSTPDTDFSVNNEIDDTGLAITNIVLPTSSARIGVGLEAGTWFDVTTGVSSATFTYATRTDTNIVRAGSTVTVTFAAPLPTNVVPGSIIWLTTSGFPADFPTGPKIVTSVAGNVYTYSEAGNIIARPVSTVWSGSSAAPNLLVPQVLDIVNIPENSTFVSGNKGHFQVSATAALSFTVTDTSTTFVAADFGAVVDLANFQFFPIDTAQTTTANIVSTINSNFPQYLNAYQVGVGAGIIDKIYRYDNTFEASLDDGVNYVLEYQLGGDIVLKDTVTLNTGLSYDTANETMRLVPVTTDAVARWLNSSAVSGLVNTAEIVAGDSNKRLQFNTLSVGSGQTIEVTGGSGNNISTPLIGVSITPAQHLLQFTVDSDSVSGFTSDHMVKLATNQLNTKTKNWTNATKLAINTAGDTITLSVAGSFRTAVETHSPAAGRMTVTKMGDYAFVYFGAIGAGLAPGWVEIKSTDASAANTGVFKVIVTVLGGAWIYNPNAVEETVTLAGADRIVFWSYDSLMPGDTLTIMSNVLGDNNIGTWTILDTPTGLTTTTVTVSGMTTKAATAIADTNDFITKEGTLGQFWVLVKHLHLNSDNNDQTTVLVRGVNIDDFVSKITQLNGYYMQALDKLEFDNYVHSGRDAYKYNTGLINEAHKVIYGDQNSPVVYPGVIAAGTNVNIHGPLIRAVELTLDIRLKTGFTDADTIPLIQNAVASRINATKIGEDVDLSIIIAAARSVQGVTSVVATSPALTNSTDIISVQDNEKAMVLNPDTDITINILGN